MARRAGLAVAKTEFRSPVSARLQAIVVAHEHAELARLLRENGSLILADMFKQSAEARKKQIPQRKQTQ